MAPAHIRKTGVLDYMDTTRGTPDDGPLPGCNEIPPVLDIECASEDKSKGIEDEPKLVFKPEKDGYSFSGFLPYTLLSQPEQLLSLMADIIRLSAMAEMTIPGYLGKLTRLHDLIIDLEYKRSRLVARREGEPDKWLKWL